jgi:hypothetical protein
MRLLARDRGRRYPTAGAAREALLACAAYPKNGRELLSALRQVSDWIRTPEERRTMPIRKLIPHDRGDWALYGITSVLAGVAEEAAYRGALMSVLIGLTGSTALSVMMSALAFTLGHAVQGGKSMVVVFAMALLMHGLVFVTGTLVVAMVVHAGYDLLAGALGARDAVASA